MFFVRTASQADLPSIRELLIDTWHSTYDDIYGAEKVDEIVEDWFSTENLAERLVTPHSEFLVADNGEVVGGVAYATQKAKTIQLHQLYVLPEFHGGKTGLHLLIEIENSFPEAEKISLEVEEKNSRAVRFYEKYGFETTSRTNNCGKHDSGIPALIMEKPINYADDL